MKHEDLTGRIIGAAMEVLNTLNPGLDEKLYENALAIEWQARGMITDQQKPYSVLYKTHPIGCLVPDLIVDETVIVDTKVVTDFSEAHTAQMIGYLTIASLEVALLLNFKYSKLIWKRIVL